MSDVRFQGQHAINNGVDSRATTVNVGVQDQQQHTSQGQGVPVANLLDHQAGSDGTSVQSTLTESITSRGHPSERGLRDLLSEIWVECSDALEAIGMSLSDLAAMVKDGFLDQEDEASLHTCDVTERILSDVRQRIPEEDYVKLVHSRDTVIKKMADGDAVRDRSSSLGSVAEDGIDGTSPTFGRMIKMLAALVPLLLQLSPYWQAGPEFYESLSDVTKERITSAHKLLDDIGRNIVFPAQVLMGDYALAVNLCEIAVPKQMWLWAVAARDDEHEVVLHQPRREECQDLLAHAMRVAEEKDSSLVLSVIAKLQAAIFLPALAKVVALRGMAKTVLDGVRKDTGDRNLEKRAIARQRLQREQHQRGDADSVRRLAAMREEGARQELERQRMEAEMARFNAAAHAHFNNLAEEFDEGLLAARRQATAEHAAHENRKLDDHVGTYVPQEGASMPGELPLVDAGTSISLPYPGLTGQDAELGDESGVIEVGGDDHRFSDNRKHDDDGDDTESDGPPPHGDHGGGRGYPSDGDANSTLGDADATTVMWESSRKSLTDLK